MNASSSTTIDLQPLPYVEDASDYYRRIRTLPWPVWLDSGSATRSAHSNRYDILSAAPCSRIFCSSDGDCYSLDRAGERTQHADVWQALEQLLPSEAVQLPDTPFCGGALGFIGYDCGKEQQRLPRQIADDAQLPLAQLGIYRWAIIQDHHQQRSWLLLRDDTPEVLRRLLQELLLQPQQADSPATFSCDAFTPDMSAGHYHDCIERIQEYIQAGDCYQVNFAQRFHAHYSGDTFTAYQQLRQALPSPFSCYFETDEIALLSISPERFIRCHQNHVMTQPIKGTIRRGADPQEDAGLARQLLNSSKDQAENLMIVDLLRNDLSKVCTAHSVSTPQLFALESYANVHHLVSTVTGTLRADMTAVDLLAASFPGGSITGAPKIRAMEIIEELESRRRGAYCGAIGYLGFDGKMDTNIAIRTAVASGGQLYVWGGGGIVADSDPTQEYQESLTKVRLIMDTLEQCGARPA
ncbi:aminodeoxychorismate synthase component I [Pseudomaricurvus sp. HS19]|uniref:aminodeoxychorismate synthase component I n=1 Tax=Pseudomaricurvus sp. HS19 TaxID=2692626 RepID=UPI001F02EC4B|nr:aminodeoxychorismate synthase component I [Pseudomaricurvus sp. HS19]